MMRCQVRMLTGDSVETAVAIAKQCGILSQGYALQAQSQGKGLAQAQLQSLEAQRLQSSLGKQHSGSHHPAPSPRPSATGQQAMTGAQFRSLVLREDGSIDQVRLRCLYLHTQARIALIRTCDDLVRSIDQVCLWWYE